MTKQKKDVAKTEQMEKGSKDAVYITFSKKMILSKTEHSNPSKIDKKTNERMLISKIALPSKQFRNLNFGKDDNGVDRDERLASINIVSSFIKENKNDKGEVQNYFAYLQKDHDYKVNFNSKEVENKGEKTYDKPIPLKLKGSDLAKVYKEAREIRAKAHKEKEEKQKEIFR